MCTEAEFEERQKTDCKYKLLYSHVDDFCHIFEHVERDAVCPGFR